MWTSEEIEFLKNLKSPQGIQAYLDSLDYNPEDMSLSPRFVMLSGDAHCLEGAFLAAAALEVLGHPPLIVQLQANENDDSHMIAVYKTKTGWGSIAKSNTTLLRGRYPVYRSIRELAMSYFDFYFDTQRRPSLYAYSDTINLNRYNEFDWRTSEEDLTSLGQLFNDLPHFELIDLEDLGELNLASEKVKDACFLGANYDGFFT